MTGREPAGGVSRRARQAGGVGLGLMGLAIAVMAAIALLGPSAAVPDVGGDGPPWSLRAAPPAPLVLWLCWAAVIAGGLGLAVALGALRRGWRPRRGLLPAGTVIAVAVLAFLPPAGSTDVLNYAVYGRIAALGHDPYVTTPAWLHEIADPVGRYAPLAWRNAPSVYGPLATWAQTAAAMAGGGTMAGTVLLLKLGTALAFLLSAVMLGRLAGRDPARRARVHLLWSLNPLMLWHVVLGGHVDGLGAVFLMAAFLALRRGGVIAGLAAGVLLGAAAAVKAPFILAGAGLAWAARRSAATFLAMVMGTGTALVAAYATQGTDALGNLMGKIGAHSLADPWRVITDAMGLGMESSVLEGRLALGAAFLIGVLLCWGLPAGPPGRESVRPALAWCLCWLLTSPVQHPWYDALLFPLLALMPAGRLDGLMIARGVVTSLIYLPGAAAILTPTPFTQWIAEIYRPWAAPLAADLIIVCVVALALAGGFRPAVWAPAGGPVRR
ncbi:hypothetical protein [Sphaerisporangium dianthi]|uniref:DUF2029 domain-containing protein n=1 Tax=Sphaerisporangium dianthi TaxID=1436120 RepID=A0ABV9CAH0_9ACTN